MSPPWLLYSGESSSVKGVWMNRTRKKITTYDFQTHYYLIFALFSWLSLSVNKKFLHHHMFAIYKSNWVIISESRNPGLPVLLPFLPTILMEHRKKMESFGQWTGHSHNIFCFQTQLKIPHYATGTCLVTSSGTVTVLMLCSSTIFTALVTLESWCKRDIVSSGKLLKIN